MGFRFDFGKGPSVGRCLESQEIAAGRSDRDMGTSQFFACQRGMGVGLDTGGCKRTRQKGGRTLPNHGHIAALRDGLIIQSQIVDTIFLEDGRDDAV